MKFHDVVTTDDLREVARRRVPRVVFDMLDGGAGDEYTLDRNRQGFAEITFRPKPFVDVASRDLSVEVYGDRISVPFMLAPTGAGRAASPLAELAVARAASSAGTIYMQSTVTSYSLEDVAAAAARPLWYQLYLPPNRDETRAMLDRVEHAGYSALSLTVDTPVFGNRERDAHNKVTVPLQLRPGLVIEGLSRPAWSAQFVRGNLSLGGRLGTNKVRQLSPTVTQGQIIATQWPVTLDDVKMVRDLWKGPLLIKGLMRADELPELAGIGVDGVVVSNHGGRQLDGVPGTIEVLPEFVSAAGPSMDVFLDGGIRRGTDIVKALAIGARAVFIGRPYLYGLAAAGEEGVARAIAILSAEVDKTLALLGCRSIDEVTADLVNTPSRARTPAQASGTSQGRSPATSPLR